MNTMKRTYLAGPMRGIPKYNFPAFHEAAEALRMRGLEVVSPAELDIQHGFDPEKDSPSPEFLRDALRRDFDAVLLCDFVTVLPGWRASKGATTEVALARAANKPVLEYPSLNAADDDADDILTEALRLTSGDRQAQYGPPDQDFQRTATMWSALLGVSVSTQQVALCMIALKLSRACHQSKRDTAVDIAGYARCYWMCVEAAEARGKPVEWCPSLHSETVELLRSQALQAGIIPADVA